MTTAFIDAIREPALVINLSARSQQPNDAARELWGDRIADAMRNATLLNAIRDLALGRQKAPLDIELQLERDGELKTHAASVLPGTGHSEFLVVVHALPVQTVQAAPVRDAHDNAVAAFVELVRNQLLEPLRETATRLATLGDATRAPEAVAQDCADLAERLEKVVDLVAVFGQDALITDERVMPGELVQEVLTELRPAAARMKVMLVAEGFDDTLAPIYGSSAWLRRALRECVENAIRHARSDVAEGITTTVEVKPQQLPASLMLRVVNRGAGRFASVQSTVRPFDPRAAKDAAQTGGLRIGLALAQRIVEMHEGHLRIRQDDGVTEVLMELPTGGVRRHNARLDIDQAQRYAEDLAKLMARRRAKQGA